MARPILLTRPMPQSREFLEAVEARCPGKFTPILTPLLKIKAESTSVSTEGVQALLFTSRNAVMAFAAQNPERSLPALCVGDATMRVAQDQGFAAQSARGDASALATLVSQVNVDGAGHFLHFRGAHVAGDLIDALHAEGIPAEERIIYDQVKLSLSEEAQRALTSSVCVVPIFSPRSARVFLDEMDKLQARPPHFVVISQKVADILENTPSMGTSVATEPTASSVLDCIAAM